MRLSWQTSTFEAHFFIVNVRICFVYDLSFNVVLRGINSFVVIDRVRKRPKNDGISPRHDSILPIQLFQKILTNQIAKDDGSSNSQVTKLILS